MVQAVLRRSEVERATGLRRSSMYEKIAEGKFPKPIRINSNSVGWLETEVAAWQHDRIEERNASSNGEAM